MNVSRRKRLERLEALMSEARGLLEEVASEEREATEALPDGIRDSDRGQRMEEIAEILEAAVDTIEELETQFADCRE